MSQGFGTPPQTAQSGSAALTTLSPTVGGQSNVQGALEALASGAGANVNDAGYDLILLAGQSNMVGYGTPADTVNFDTPDDRVYVYASGGTYPNKIVRAVEPLYHDGAESLGVGPGMSFARWYAGVIPSNRRVLLVPHGHLGSMIQNWIDTYGGQAITAAQAALVAAGANARVAAVLWVQGEADSTNSTIAAAYAANLDTLIGSFRTAFGDANLPFIVGQMTPGYIAASAFGDVVTAAHIDTPRRKVRTGFAYGISGHDDGTHGDPTWNRYEGEAMFRAYVRALLNVLGTAPLTPSAVTAQQNGTSIDVAWTQSAGRATDYTVQYKLAASGSWTTLTRAQSIGLTASITGLTGGQTYNVRVATVNEQGTSAYIVADPVVMSSPPGQTVGLAAGTATSTTQPLTWTATATATSYLVEYKTHVSGTWLTSQTVSTNAATVTGLTASTSYDYRVTPINGAGSGTVSSPLTASTAAGSSSLLLDVVGASAHRALGLRKLKTGATNCIRVRRSSDNTEQDIGFSGSALDTSALATFVGGGSGYVVTFYDQSGNSRDVTIATAGFQPRIVNAGTLDTLNSKPTLIFDGTDDRLSGTVPALYANGSASVLAVLKGNAGAPFSEGGAGTGTYFALSDGLNISHRAFNDAGGFPLNISGTVGVASALKQLTFIDTGTAITQRVDAAASISGTTYARSGVLTLTTFDIGALDYSGGRDFFWAGGISEVVTFLGVLSTGDRDAGEANQKAYYGTA